MERVFTVKGSIISIDNWCNNNIDENTELITALRACLVDHPELEIFKPQVRACIRNWQEDKRLLGDVEIVEIDIDEVNGDSYCGEEYE